MILFLQIALVIAVGATLVSLGFGVISLFKSSPHAKSANTYMRWRVILQGVSLLIFTLLLLWRR